MNKVIEKQIEYYLQNNTTLELENLYTPAHTFFNRKYWNRYDIDSIIPTCKHREFESKLDNIESKNVENGKQAKYKTLIVDTFNSIETTGLFTLDGYEYTKYNLFTKTGRPSNSNNGINYAAINKDDGSRQKYISRFDNGILAEFDYDAYHLRLISNLIDYKQPTESFHKYLGKIYFDKKEITKKEYNESKKITFRILYGGIPEEFKNIEYFAKINKYIFNLWDIYISKGYIETPILRRRFYKKNFSDMNPQKLFNYMIQAYETESNCEIMQNVLEFLDGKFSKLVLYVYDAFVFDISPDDGKEVLTKIKNLMKYPTSLKIGRDYHNMKHLSV